MDSQKNESNAEISPTPDQSSSVQSSDTPAQPSPAPDLDPKPENPSESPVSSPAKTPETTAVNQSHAPLERKTTAVNQSHAPLERKKSKPTNPPLVAQKTLTDTKLYRKAFQGVKKTRSLLKESPLALLTLLRKNGYTREEIVEQTAILIEDYVYSRLLQLLPASEDKEAIIEKNMAELTEVSRELQLIGLKLETTYPYLYENISKQVNQPSFKSEASVKRVISCVGDTMFKNGHVTWCRMVAMLAVTAGVAVECAKNSKVEFVGHCLTTLTEVMDKYAVDWVMQQGGWVDLTREYRVITNEARKLWTLSGIGASIGFACLWVLTLSL